MDQAQALRSRSVGGRYLELDSLRGIAALLVLGNHLGFAFGYKPYWLLLPFFAGHEAVVLFFLLSGFVLSLPFWNKGTSGPYFPYIVRRFFRIYVPFAAAAVVAAFVAHFFLFSTLPLGIWSTTTWQRALTPSFFVSQLLMTPDGALNVAFWSLRYEVQLSIALPFLLLAIRRLGSIPSLTLAVLAHLLARSGLMLQLPDPHWYLETIEFGAIFVFGAVLARHRLELHRHWDAAGRRVHGIFGLAALVVFFYSYTVLWHLHRLDVMLSELWICIGAAGLVLVSMFSHNVRTALRSRIPEFFGRLSFSLYLMHGTVLFFLLNFLRGKATNATIGIGFLILSFAAAYLFCILVEEPALRLGKRLVQAAPASAGSPAPNLTDRTLN